MTGKPEILVTWLILNCWRTVFKQHVLFAMISVKGKTSIDALRLLRSQVPNFSDNSAEYNKTNTQNLSLLQTLYEVH